MSDRDPLDEADVLIEHARTLADQGYWEAAENRLLKAEALLARTSDDYERTTRSEAVLELRERMSDLGAAGTLAGAEKRSDDPTGPVIDHPFHVIVMKGYDAWADDEGGALLAARTLLSDLAQRGGSRTLLRRDIIITRDGVYDASLTSAARSGRSQL